MTAAIEIKIGALKPAKTKLSDVLKEEPKNLIALNLYAMIHRDLGEIREQIEILKRLVTCGMESVEVLNDLGNALVAINYQEEAIKSFKKALKLEPKNAKIYYNLISISNETLDENA